MSVVVPARDQAEHVETALLSLTRQLDDPRELEVVVVDDGSVDGTGDLVEAMSGRFARLELVRNDVAIGLAASRNSGLNRVTGRYVAFLDGDDWFGRGHLQTLADATDHLGVDFVRTDHVRDTDGRRTVHRVPEHRRGMVLDPRDGIGPVDRTSAVDYPFAPFGLYDSRLRDDGRLYFVAGLHTAEDRPWIWRLHLHASTWAVVDTLGAFYRRGDRPTLSRVLDQRQLDFLRAYGEVFALIARAGSSGTVWAKAVRQFLAICAHHLARFTEQAPHLVAEARDGIAVVLATAPDHVVARTVADLDAPRRATLSVVPGLVREDPASSAVLAPKVAS